MALNCPGYNANVLPVPEKGHGLGDGKSQGEADLEAKGNAEGEALTKAWAKFPANMCPPPCGSIPILRIIDSGAVPVAAKEGATHFASVGWAEAQLDVLCIEYPASSTSNPTDDEGLFNRVMRKIMEREIEKFWNEGGFK